MIQFLLGFVASEVVRSNKRQVGRTLASFAVKAGSAATYLKNQACRLSAGVMEDYEDLVAEARAEREAGYDRPNT